MSQSDRSDLIARRDALKARLEHERRIQLIQPVIDILNGRGIAFVVLTDNASGTLPSWPVVGDQIDWRNVTGATYSDVESAAGRDAAFRSLLHELAAPNEWVDVIPANGDAPIVRVQSGDLADVCGPVLDEHISVYVAAADGRWLIENVEGRGLWGGLDPARSPQTDQGSGVDTPETL